MGDFFRRLSYSFGNEDWETEQEALQTCEEDTILCVTASGDRPLHLLTHPCKKIISVDANPIQNHLLELKKHAVHALSFEQFLPFLGLTPCSQRIKQYHTFKHLLHEEAKDFWNQNLHMIDKGVIYQGTIERFLKIASKLLQFCMRKKISTLFSFNCIEKQREFIRTSWNTPLWKLFSKWFLHPNISKLFIKDPGLYQHLGPNISPGKYITSRMHKYLLDYPAKQSLLISLVFQGKVYEEGYPPLFQKETFPLIKKNLQKIETTHANLIPFLEQSQSHCFSRFSISDVASYLKEKDFIRLLKGMLHTATPGARFCMRQFMSEHKIPQELAPYFKREEALEKKLEKQDRCFVYRYMIGTIQK